MTLISANSMALTILNQTFFTRDISQNNAANSILNIVADSPQKTAQAIDTIVSLASRVTKVKQETVATKEIVSAAIPQATVSAMNAAATYIMSSSYIKPIERTAENAEAIVKELISMASRASPRQVSKIFVPAREEYDAQYAEWGAKRIANGEDEAVVKKQVAYFISDRVYEGQVKMAELNNSLDGTYCEVSRQYMHDSEKALKEFFGSAIVLKLGENGQVSVTPGTLYYGNGQKMVEYKETGELETFDKMGSLVKAYKKSELQSYSS